MTEETAQAVALVVVTLAFGFAGLLVTFGASLPIVTTVLSVPLALLIAWGRSAGSLDETSAAGRGA